MTELIDVLNELARDIDFHESIAEEQDEKYALADEYFHKLKAVYSRIDRHKYSDISKYINSHQQDEMYILCGNLLCVIECAKSNDYDKDPENERQCFVKLTKLYDHVELELSRCSSLGEMKALAQQHKKEADNLRVQLAEMEKTIKEAQEKSKHLSEQLISILGIFAGIIITFSFATTVAGETLVALSKWDVTYWAFVLCVLGLVFANLIALLLSFVTKLSGHVFSNTFPRVIYILSNLIMAVAAILLFRQLV